MVMRRKVDGSEGFLRDLIESCERDRWIGSRIQLIRARLRSRIQSSDDSDYCETGLNRARGAGIVTERGYIVEWRL